MPRRVRRLRRILPALAAVITLSSCSWVSGWFGDDDEIKVDQITVFEAAVGDCFLAPERVQTALADLSRVDCSDPHEQELYEIVKYDADVEDFPGNAALESFAQGTCAQEFAGYVGIGYQDSSLWMTYLLPSARSWQQGKDRSVLCFVTTTVGEELVGSVAGSKR